MSIYGTLEGVMVSLHAVVIADEALFHELSTSGVFKTHFLLIGLSWRSVVE
ncbi:Hypothetical protein FKW44_014822 [Caligus rogercresseyi]|uniref:Uncharacterized protein n=1 Tax=Caligus rogercresseyi TaxID=217165 RepID=A0A7T8GZP6_CALRO|nr:Hypothetical protein FKW44_014822 [Caligus rogercresseyi]